MTKHLCALLFSLLGLRSGAAQAAACCGGGFAAPSLIVGDERGQLTTSLTSSRIYADVGADQLWRPREDGLTLQDVRVEGAGLLSDRWQLGGTLPISRRARDGASSTGFGDLSINLGYEYLTDWTYHRWRPKALGFVKLIAPTGRDAYSVTDPLDARGRGFWALGLGSLSTKNFEAWDAFATTHVHYAFPRHGLRPGWGADLGGGLGYNWTSVRIGGALNALWEDGVSKTERVTTASLSVSRLISSEWATTLTFSDQTWFGRPTNTSLARGVMVWVQKRWPR